MYHNWGNPLNIVSVVQWAAGADDLEGSFAHPFTGSTVQSQLLHLPFLSFLGIEIVSIGIFIINYKDLMSPRSTNVSMNIIFCLVQQCGNLGVDEFQMILKCMMYTHTTLFLMVLGIEPMTLYILGKCCTCELYSKTCF